MSSQDAYKTETPDTPLKQEMRRQGVRPVQLAAQTGIRARVLAKYRSGEDKPRDWFDRVTPNGVKIADALGVPADVLFPPRNQGGAGW